MVELRSSIIVKFYLVGHLLKIGEKGGKTLRV
jgi:hypothetical protein